LSIFADDGFFLAALLLGVALIPEQHRTTKLTPDRLIRTESNSAVDLIYSLMLFMLAILLVLGSLAFMTLTGHNYFGALLRTLIVAALALCTLSWL